MRKNTRSDRRIGGVRGGLQWSVASAYDKSYVCSIDWLDWLRLGARLRGTHPDNQSDTHPWGDLEPGLILVVLSATSLQWLTKIVNVLIIIFNYPTVEGSSTPSLGNLTKSLGTSVVR